MNNGERKLKYQDLMNEFLALREWTDQPDVDLDKNTISYVTDVSFGNQDGRLIIEIDDETDIFDVFFYYDNKCKKEKLDQMAILLNQIHLRWTFGRFEILPDGYVRWRHRCDFEGSQPTSISLNMMVQPGWESAQRFADVIAAVALTKQTAQDAIDEYDTERQKKEAGDEITEL